MKSLIYNKRTGAVVDHTDDQEVIAKVVCNPDLSVLVFTGTLDRVSIVRESHDTFVAKLNTPPSGTIPLQVL